jgi:hypothetical protein
MLLQMQIALARQGHRPDGSCVAAHLVAAEGGTLSPLALLHSDHDGTKCKAECNGEHLPTDGKHRDSWPFYQCWGTFKAVRCTLELFANSQRQQLSMQPMHVCATCVVLSMLQSMHFLCCDDGWHQLVVHLI